MEMKHYNDLVKRKFIITYMYISVMMYMYIQYIYTDVSSTINLYRSE